ncbi:MAG: ribonuclease M5 [Solobacterium sp.]|nr:ribonuclease M5 [Solobacterium sp.]
MKQIKEVIVVEGKHDTATLKKFFICDTIETNGLSLSEETLQFIKDVQKKRGIIILTDPDSPGNRIRDKINQSVENCKNAFLQKKDARTNKKVGIEHAQENVLIEALENVVTYEKTPTQTITTADFYELGLLGQTNSKQLRNQVGEKLHIGSGTAKTMLHRMNCLKIQKEELERLL